MESVEAEGRTVKEATEQALSELGLRPEEVSVEILSEGRPRLLGFLGEPARVRVTAVEVVAAPPPPVVPLPEVEETEQTFVVDEDVDDDEDYDEDEDGEDDEDEDGEDDEDEYLEDEEYEEEEADAGPVALIRPDVAPVETNPEDIATAVATLSDLLGLVSVEATVTSRPPETAGDGAGMMEAVLDVDGEDLGILIGRRGSTLAALQYLLNLIVSKKAQRRVAFGVDVDGYRRRREETLVSLARRMAARARSTGRSVTLEAMPPNERRIVHLALADDPAVMTVSMGEGEDRKVAITPSG